MIGVAHAACATQTWRKLVALGFSFAKERSQVVHDNKVMQALKEVERLERGAGLALLPTFFPGKLRPDEEARWTERKAEAEWNRGSTEKV